MTPEQRQAHLEAARRFRLTDTGVLALLEGLAESPEEAPRPRPPARERACRNGHPATEREPNGQCRVCRRERERGRVRG